MIAFNWKIVVITIVYSYWCVVRADRKDASNNLNKLVYWQRDPSLEDTRRLHKKQTRPDIPEKYPRVFQAVDYNNDSNKMTSSDHSLTGEINEAKYENQQEKKSLLNVGSPNNHSSIIVWQNYVKKDKFKNKGEETLKYTKSSQVDTEVTNLKQNTGLNHIHFKKIADSERIYKWKKETVQDDKKNNEIYSVHPSTMKNTTENSTKSTKSVRPQTVKERDLENQDSMQMSKDLNDSSPEERKERLDAFLTPYAIVPQITKILSQFKYANVTTEILERTAEYNDIVLFKIASTKNNSLANFRSCPDPHKYDDTNPEKKIIFIVHGLTVMGINALSCLSQKDNLKILLGYYLEHLDKFDIFLIPMANPDGYVASKPRGRGFWNKNMSPQADCRGVMLDRNFDIAWNNSHDISSCSQAYPGPNPFSEIESKAISNVFHYHGHRMLAYIHVHAGTYDTFSFKGDAVLYPRGYTDIAGDDDKYFDIKGDIDESLRNATFRALSVTMDTLYHWYGKVYGTSVDYAEQVFGISYAMEFVMQLYENDLYASQEEEFLDYNALTQIWKRIISIVFRRMAKSIGIVHSDETK